MDKKNIFIIILATLNILAIVFAVLAINFLFGIKYETLEAKIKLKKAEANIKNIKNLEESLEVLTEENKKTSSVFLKENNVVSFIETVENLGRSSNVKLDISSINFNPTQGEEIKSFRLNINTEGSFQNIFYFISLLEKVSYSILFNKVSLQKIDNENNDEILWKSGIDFSVLSY